MAEKSDTMGFVHDREDASPAANELMSRDLVDLEPFKEDNDIPCPLKYDYIHLASKVHYSIYFGHLATLAQDTHPHLHPCS